MPRYAENLNPSLENPTRRERNAMTDLHAQIDHLKEARDLDSILCLLA